jgi:hypothetical protein
MAKTKRAKPSKPKVVRLQTRKDIIKDALEKIRRANNGRLTSEAVVRAATNPNHVLHREFEWDDRKAAAHQRLDRAQELIARYVTVVVIHKSMKIKAPFYVRDPEAGPHEQGHVALTSEHLDRVAATEIVLNEVERCESAITRARNIAGVLDKSFPGLSDELEQMLEKLILIRRKLAA